jgi:hypothetical protein
MGGEPEPATGGRVSPLIERALAPAHVLTLVRRLQPAAVAPLVEDLLGPTARSEHQGVGGYATAPVGLEDSREIHAHRVIGPHRR